MKATFTLTTAFPSVLIVKSPTDVQKLVGYHLKHRKLYLQCVPFSLAPMICSLIFIAVNITQSPGFLFSIVHKTIFSLERPFQTK